MKLRRIVKNECIILEPYRKQEWKSCHEKYTVSLGFDSCSKYNCHQIQKSRTSSFQILSVIKNWCALWQNLQTTNDTATN